MKAEGPCPPACITPCPWAAGTAPGSPCSSWHSTCPPPKYVLNKAAPGEMAASSHSSLLLFAGHLHHPEQAGRPVPSESSPSCPRPLMDAATWCPEHNVRRRNFGSGAIFPRHCPLGLPSGEDRQWQTAVLQFLPNPLQRTNPFTHSAGKTVPENSSVGCVKKGRSRHCPAQPHKADTAHNHRHEQHTSARTEVRAGHGPSLILYTLPVLHRLQERTGLET